MRRCLTNEIFIQARIKTSYKRNWNLLRNGKIKKTILSDHGRKNIEGAAGTLAPGLVGALDGVGSLSEALTVINDSTTTPPEIKVKLRELALEEERVELEAFEAEVIDRQSAREREITLIKAGRTNHMMSVIGWGTIIVFVGLVSVLSGIIDLPGDVDREFMMLATGAVFGNMATIVAYFYGSTHKAK